VIYEEERKSRKKLPKKTGKRVLYQKTNSYNPSLIKVKNLSSKKGDK